MSSRKKIADEASTISPDLIEEIMWISENDLENIIFNEDIEKGMEKLKKNLGPGPDNNPVIFLIKTSKK